MPATCEEPERSRIRWSRPPAGVSGPVRTRTTRIPASAAGAVAASQATQTSGGIRFPAGWTRSSPRRPAHRLPDGRRTHGSGDLPAPGPSPRRGAGAQLPALQNLPLPVFSPAPSARFSPAVDHRVHPAERRGIESASGQSQRISPATEVCGPGRSPGGRLRRATSGAWCRSAPGRRKSLGAGSSRKSTGPALN